MIPNADKALRLVNRRMMSTLLPDLSSTFVQSDGMLLGMLIENLATELATGIERRLQDIEAVKSLFREAMQQVKEEGLDDAMSQCLHQQPASMSLADVNQVHDQLHRVLIDLHAHTEAAGLDELNGAIWRYLEDHAVRHQLAGV